MHASTKLAVLVTAVVVSTSNGKVLNNLVTELVGMEAQGLKHGARIEFHNPRNGWVWISSTATTDAAAPVTVRLLGETVNVHRRSGTQEAFRLLTEGRHNVTVDVPASARLDRLVIRAVPELVYSKFGADPHVQEYGKYDWTFLGKHVLPSLNVMVGAGGEAERTYAEQWAAKGGRWIVECGVPGLSDKDPPTVDQAERYWLENPGYADARLGGVIADEFVGTDEKKYTAWTAAIRRLRNNPRFPGKRFYPYWATTCEPPANRALVQAVVDAGWSLAWEQYLPEQRTEAAARAFIEKHLRDATKGWRKAMPGIQRRLVVCLGTFSQPPESLDIDPAVNYKTYLDMQMHMLATDPAFEGLAGVMTYLSSYTDEETVRWMGKLFRHYGIEGKTERLCSDPYTLPHLRNPDFEDGFNGWTVEPAAQDSIAQKTVDGFSWLQGRYPQTKQGNTVLWMKRCAQSPNRVSQTMRALMSGRLYALRMFSADARDPAAKQKLTIAVTVEGAEILRDRSFQHVFANCYSHHWGPYSDKNPAWMNYHWIVFRAKATEATLRISDWLSEREPGGTVSQELQMNFVEVQPYDPPD